jgi:hypothetical protein
MRRHAQDPGEEPQEMKRAEPDLRRRGLEADGILGMSIDPERGRHRAAAIRSSRRRRPYLASGHHLDETRRQQQPQLIETDIAASLGRGLGKFAQHHELGQPPPPVRCATARPPRRSPRPNRGRNERRGTRRHGHGHGCRDIRRRDGRPGARRRPARRTGRGCGSRSSPFSHRRGKSSHAALGKAHRPARPRNESRRP